MDVKSLTPKQKEVLEYIRTYIEEQGYSPSLAEIADEFDRAIPTIHQYIDALVEKDFLRKEENVARGIKPVEKDRNEIFLLGEIAAGEPIDPLENPEPISVPPKMLRDSGGFYALRVRGDSMIEEGIMDGDLIVVKHQNRAANGDKVVAVTEDGATLKVYRERDGEVYLEPRNPRLQNIYPNSLEIRGLFVGLLRNL